MGKPWPPKSKALPRENNSPWWSTWTLGGGWPSRSWHQLTAPDKVVETGAELAYRKLAGPAQRAMTLGLTRAHGGENTLAPLHHA